MPSDFFPRVARLALAIAVLTAAAMLLRLAAGGAADADSPSLTEPLASAFLPYASAGTQRGVPAGDHGQVGGASYAVRVRDRVAYLAQGPRLVMLDVTDPTKPSVLGRSPILRSMTSDVVLDSDFAFVASGVTGVTIHDVSDPARPRQIGRFAPEGYTRNVVVGPGRAYALALNNEEYLSYSRVWVYDTTDITNPVALGSMPVPFSQSRLAVSGDQVYVGTYYDYSGVPNGELWVIDVSDPSDPRKVGAQDLYKPVSDLVAQDDLVYLASGNISVVDVSEPAAPELLAGGTAPRSVGIASDGTNAYVLAESAGDELPILQVFTPPFAGWPLAKGATHTWSYHASALEVSGGHAYVVNAYHGVGDGGVEVFDVGDPAKPLAVGRFAAPGEVRRVERDGELVWATDWSSTWLVDVGDARAPVPLAHVDAPANYDRGLKVSPSAVALSGDFAYVVSPESAWGPETYLQVLDRSDSSSLRQVSRLRIDGYADTLAANDSALYLLTSSRGSSAGLLIVDVSDPERPIEVERRPLPSTPGGAIVVGGHLYVIASGEFLLAFDVKDPLDPKPVGELTLPGRAQDITWTGKHLAVSDVERGLHLVDVSDPADLRIIGSRTAVDPEALGSPRVDCAGDRCYVTSQFDGLEIVDISDPERPTALGFERTLNAVDVTVAEGVVVVADSIGGVRTFTDDSVGQAPHSRAGAGLKRGLPDDAAVHPHGVGRVPARSP